MAQFNPNVGRPTFDSPSQLAQGDDGGGGQEYGGWASWSQWAANGFRSPTPQPSADEVRRQAQERERQRVEAERQKQISDAYQQYSQSMQSGGMFNLSGTSGEEVQRNPFDVSLIDQAQFANRYQGLRDAVGGQFDPRNVLTITGDASGDFAGGDFTGMLAYDIPDDFGTIATNLITPKAVSAGASIAAGETAFNALGLEPKTAAQVAMATDVGLEGILSASKIANTVQLADGTVGYITNFGGKRAFTTRDAVTERNKALALEMANQPEDDAGRAVTESLGQGLSIVAQTSQRKPDWTDYYKPSFGFDPDEFVMDIIGGKLSQSDLKSVQLAGRISSGEDLVSAAVGVYGDAVRELLPEGYEKPTEAAIRIGMGENRVKVFGDVYGADFNLDNPLGKAGLKGAEVYDMTGDGEEALQKSIYTYFKEGGKLPDFEVPNFLPEVDLDFNFEKFKMAGFSLKDMYDFGVDMPSLNLDWNTISGEGLSFAELPELGFDLKKIDFGGTKLGEIEGLNLDNLGDYGLDIGDLPSMNIDFSFDLKMRKRKQLESLEDEEEFASLEEDQDLLDPTRSLARELLGMEQTKSVQQAQENA